MCIVLAVDVRCVGVHASLTACMHARVLLVVVVVVVVVVDCVFVSDPKANIVCQTAATTGDKLTHSERACDREASSVPSRWA